MKAKHFYFHVGFQLYVLPRLCCYRKHFSWAFKKLFRKQDSQPLLSVLFVKYGLKKIRKKKKAKWTVNKMLCISYTLILK